MKDQDNKEVKEETWQERVARLSEESKSGKAMELRKDKIYTSLILSSIGIVVVGGFVALLATCSDSPEKAALRKEKAEASAKARAERLCKDTRTAFNWSKEVVKQNLRSPASAEFPARPVVSEYLGNCRTRIISTVDSQNGFGAMIRSSYSVEMTYHKGSDSWSANSLVIE